MLKKRLRACREMRAEIISIENNLNEIKRQTTTLQRLEMSVPADVERLKNEYAERLTKLAAEVRKSESLIDLCSVEIGRVILRERYINGVAFEDIPDLYNISAGTMWRAYRRAVKEICEKAKVDSE